MQTMTETELDQYRLHRRFDRIGRLIGDDGMKRLLGSHVLVVGLGGVGSFAAEMLVRSGVGHLTLVDFDDICITNFNRQMHALGGNVGKAKTEVMAERLKQINPQIHLRPLKIFYQSDSADSILEAKDFGKVDFVIDAIDSVKSKCHLIATCKQRRIPLITSTGSGGRLNPTDVRVADLAQTQVDPLARDVRRILREKYDFPRDEKALFGVPAVYSAEQPIMPKELHYDQGKGFRCVCPQGDNPYFQCENRNLIMGNAGFVTATFGNVCAAEAVREILCHKS